MKDIITHTYIFISGIAIALLHGDLKDTSEALKEAQHILHFHQRALDSHKKVIKAHDDALGIVWDHFSNTQT